MQGPDAYGMTEWTNATRIFGRAWGSSASPLRTELLQTCSSTGLPARPWGHSPQTKPSRRVFGANRFTTLCLRSWVKHHTRRPNLLRNSPKCSDMWLFRTRTASRRQRECFTMASGSAPVGTGGIHTYTLPDRAPLLLLIILPPWPGPSSFSYPPPLHPSPPPCMSMKIELGYTPFIRRF